MKASPMACEGFEKVSVWQKALTMVPRLPWALGMRRSDLSVYDNLAKTVLSRDEHESFHLQFVFDAN